MPGTYTATGFANFDDAGRWFATVRGRAGLTWERFLVYGTGGVAFHEHSTLANVAVTDPTGATVTYVPAAGRSVGWAAGLGFEYAVADNVSFGVEYLNVSFGRSHLVEPVLSTINGAASYVDIRQDVDIVRAKLNIKFGNLFGTY